MKKQNLHTHTRYCDGKNSCEEFISSALRRGFSSLGFSSHAYTFGESYCMSEKDEGEYSSEVDALKQKYKGQIDIFKGIEADIHSTFEKDAYDYIIGSCHYIPCGGELYCVDLDVAETERAIKEGFGGSAIKYVKAYFDEVKKIPSATGCDIIGHFDLVTKFSKYVPGIDAGSREYLSYAVDAVHTVAEQVRIFEVNTGAMSRGYTSIPYPSISIVKEMKSCGMMPVISSDCHRAEHLDYGFCEAGRMLYEAGYREIMYLTNKGFCEIPLEV